MKRVFTLSRQIQNEAVASLERLSDALVPDVSNYAKGRTRFWLEHEAPLGKTQPWRPGVKDASLWAFCKDVWGKAHMPLSLDLGLAAYGPTGINPHRDATYAHEDTLLINFGEASFRYARSRDGADFDSYELMPGDVYRFDSKHLHASEPKADDRWVIILWHCKIPMPRNEEPERRSLEEFFC